jgi:hypothetical protein
MPSINRINETPFIPFTLTISIQNKTDAELLQCMVALAWYYSYQCERGHAVEPSHQRLPCSEVWKFCAALAEMISGNGPEYGISLNRILNGEKEA